MESLSQKKKRGIPDVYENIIIDFSNTLPVLQQKKSNYESISGVFLFYD